MTTQDDAATAWDAAIGGHDQAEGDGFELDATPETGLPQQTDLIGHLVALRPIYWKDHEGNGGFRGLHCQVLDVDHDSGEPVFYDDMLVTWSTVMGQLVGHDNDPAEHPPGPDAPTTKWRGGTVIKTGKGKNAPVRLESPNPAGQKRLAAAGAAWKRGEVKTIKRPII